MRKWVVFSAIVSAVQLAGPHPVEIELAACDAIFQPVIAHVKSLRTFHADLSF